MGERTIAEPGRMYSGSSLLMGHIAGDLLEFTMMVAIGSSGRCCFVLNSHLEVGFVARYKREKAVTEKIELGEVIKTQREADTFSGTTGEDRSYVLSTY